jgi:outer membrane cobalamin receptor
LNAEGFAAWAGLVEIRSEIPVRLAIALGVAPVTTQVEVTDAATLVDPYRPATQFSIGRQALGEYVPVQPGRDLSDLVNELPGWIYEANGILHPRGSEYDVQYAVNGVPLRQNRSPAFAPSLDAEDVESMRVLTAGFPAEYGRKLGGIVEVTTAKDLPPGIHGQIAAEGGSFSTANGSADLFYGLSKNRFSVGGDGFHTDRYLDPPVLENYTNHASAGGLTAAYERDFSERDRLRLTTSHQEVHFQVPNELVQQQAGQRQDIGNTETSGQISFQRAISAELVMTAAGSVRDASVALSSNNLATPMIVSQNRGYREGYVRADLAGHHGRHDWKVGAEGIFNPVYEELHYLITDPSQFDPRTKQQFAFSDHKWDVESSAYAQDQVRLGKWNVAGGLRFDHYSFVVSESKWSPRLAVSRYVSSWNLMLHASYDRVFQTPALENLLLASSPQLDAVNPIVVRLPVEPAHANYYEGGVTKGFLGKLRIDANVFRRDFHNYSDDDVLLDTGISFPIAFASARIIGEEVRVEVPNWGRFSGYVSYANQSGIGQGPITGGLFLGSADTSGLTDTSRFAVSQDQRNTARVGFRFQAPRRSWVASRAEYGSGLPADINGEDPYFLLAQYGPQILSHVNLDSGRVRPNFALNASAGVDFYRKEQRSVSFQIQAMNLTDRVNVINFASLFSGTAVATLRSVSARFRVTF